MRNRTILRTSVMLVAVAAAPLAAQVTDPNPDRTSFTIAGGMSKSGPLAFSALDVAMNRWFALRAEALFSKQDLPDGYPWLLRVSSGTLAGVVTFRSDKRVSPYVLTGSSLFLIQGTGVQFGSMAGAGLRLRFGSVQPFVELRAQHHLGVPLSFGLRF